MSKHIKNICTIIVTFQPDIGQLKRLLVTIMPQVAGIVVVDNGSDQAVLDSVSCSNVTLLPLGENLGVAAGFNRGIDWAKAHGFEAVLLLDQDSLPAPDMMARLAAAHERLIAQGHPVAAVGPVARDPGSGREVGFARLGGMRFRYECGAPEPVQADFLISSGSLIGLDVLARVGDMDERLFIDLVDTEWFLRARDKGLLAFGVGDALLHHGVGEGSAGVQVGRCRIGSLAYHDPLRHYYIFRNSILLNRRPYVPRRWVLNNALQLAGMFVYFSLMTAPRLAHFRMMLQGLFDGLKGRNGRYTGMETIG